MREMHWHANAAEWAYVVSGSCRTTILHPDGGSTSDDFYPGDVWYFPRGWGHAIQGTGNEQCHFILIFDNGDFSEDHTFSVTDWMSRTPPAVLAQSLGLSRDEIATLPKGEVYFAQGPAVGDATPTGFTRGEPSLVATHRYPLHAQEPRRVPGGGIQRTVTEVEFPISRTMAGSLLEIEPGGLRELHWHPPTSGNTTSKAPPRCRFSSPRVAWSPSSSRPATSATPRWPRATTSRIPAAPS